VNDYITKMNDNIDTGSITISQKWMTTCIWTVRYQGQWMIVA